MATPKPPADAPVLSPVPASTIPPKPAAPLITRPAAAALRNGGGRSLIPGLAAPSNDQTRARQLATDARRTVGTLINQLSQASASLSNTVEVYDKTEASTAPEWEREGVDIKIIRQAAQDFKALLDKYTEPPPAPAAAAT